VHAGGAGLSLSLPRRLAPAAPWRSSQGGRTEPGRPQGRVGPGRPQGTGRSGPHRPSTRSAPGKKKGYPLAAAPRKCVSCPSLLPYLRVVRDADRHGVALQLGPLVGGRVLDIVRDWEWRVERRGGRRDKRDVSVGGVARVRRERGHIPAAARAARSRLCLASLGSPQTLTAPPPARAWLGNARGRSPVERPSPAHSLSRLQRVVSSLSLLTSAHPPGQRAAEGVRRAAGHGARGRQGPHGQAEGAGGAAQGHGG